MAAPGSVLGAQHVQLDPKAGDALAASADAGVLRCPGCRPLTGHFIGRVLRDTRQRAAVRGDDLQAQHNACKGSRYAMVS
jgi:hypothetical protein